MLSRPSQHKRSTARGGKCFQNTFMEGGGNGPEKDKNGGKSEDEVITRDLEPWDQTRVGTHSAEKKPAKAVLGAMAERRDT